MRLKQVRIFPEHYPKLVRVKDEYGIPITQFVNRAIAAYLEQFDNPIIESSDSGVEIVQGTTTNTPHQNG